MHKIISVAAVAASLALAACSSEPDTVSADAPDPQAEQLKTAPPVTLPPSIASSKTYRCRDNSVVYVNFLTDGITANIRDKEEEPPRETLTAPAAGEPFVSEGYSLSGTGDSITYTSPDSGTQTCRTGPA